MPNTIIAWTAIPKIECELVHVCQVLLSGLSSAQAAARVAAEARFAAIGDKAVPDDFALK